MTDHLHALAMRTKAAERAHDQMWALDGGQLKRAILALPLEADHAALVREAVKLPEIAQAKTALHEADLMLDDGGFRDTRIHKIVKAALLALEPPE